MAQPIIIAGAGPGGLALALALHARGMPTVVYEAVGELRPLGVGINLLPHSVRVLHGLGLREALEAIAVRTAELRYYNRHGQLIWGEPRGVAAGYVFPQYSIHRGRLQLLLYREALDRLGPEQFHSGHALEDWEERDGGIVARFRTVAGRVVAVDGAGLVAADGIHSAARQRLYPDEGPPIASGRILWRGISAGPPFLSGATMIMAGHQHQKFVCYPLSSADEGTGQAQINWVAELDRPAWSPPRQDWNRQVAKERFAAHFADWRFDWLDIPALIDGAAQIYEYPMVDRHPLPRWSHGRMTLLGDAAHPMYPIGSNGASQAILDAEALADALATERDVARAFATYEEVRRPATEQIVLLNRQNGPEQVMQLAEERAPDGFADIDAVIPREELEEIAARYKQAAGFTIAQVNRG